MSLRARLHRLERQLRKGGRCPACRGRPDCVLRAIGPDGVGAVPVSSPTGGDDVGPCPACGWAPVVRSLIEVVVASRDELAGRGVCGPGGAV